MTFKEHTEIWLSTAQQVLVAEAQSLLDAAQRLDGNITSAVEILLKHQGKIVISGVGKSGHVGRKLAATLCSTGTPAIFMHPSEAVHGDLGIYTPGDPSILLSKSGTTEELMRLVPILREFESPLIAIVGNVESPLAYAVDVVIDASVKSEADPNNLAPTSSATLAMVLGDALAVTLMQAKKFTPEDFARYHPGGQLGRNLRLDARQVMKTRDTIAVVQPDTLLRDVMIEMTRKPFGAACVVGPQHKLLGIITDGDLRRALLAHDDIRVLQAKTVMTARPITITPEASLTDALKIMEDRPSQISVLPVVDGKTDECLGLLRIHDIYR